MQEDQQKQELIIKLYDQYHVSIFKYIVKMIHDVQAAEDLTQETFLKVYKYMKTDQELDYPKTYLYRTAYNLTIDHIRKQAPIQVVKDFMLDKKDPDSQVESMVELREASQELHDAIKKLKRAHQQVIILRKIEGFSIQETAEILNWSEGKVKSTMFRAIRSLERQLMKGGVINELS